VDNNFSWSDTVTAIAAVASLTVSILTYLLAKKISFRRSVKDKQFEVVSQFIRAFSSSEITISYQHTNNGGGMAAFYLSQFRMSKFKKEFNDLFLATPITIQEDGFNNFNFIPLIGDPFLPEELFVELKKFWFYPERKIQDPQAQDTYLIICNHKDYNNPRYFLPKDQEFQTFEAFYDFINKIMEITNNWLDKHEASELKFRSS
jgi:hypothetical protein